MSKRTPVSGGDGREGAPDGVSGTPGGPAGEVSGRRGGSESDGGAYPNPQSGKESTESGFMGHGGQATVAYHGGGQLGRGDAPNAATGSDSSDGTEAGAARWPAGEHQAHTVHAGGRTFEVEETNGVTEAEALGKVGTDAPYEREQEQPGAG